MQNQVKKHSQLLNLSMICSCVSSAAILLCIFAERSKSAIYLILIPTLFWVGLIVEQCLFWITNSVLRKIIKTNNVRRIYSRAGIISPFQTQLGTVADYTFIMSLILFVIFFMAEWGKDSFQFVLLFLIVSSFRIHCIANGKNYFYKIYFLRRRG